MAKKEINIGRTANDRSGDPLRSAFIKINDNFTELYARSENTDSQTLTLVGDTLSISGGNSVTLPASGGTANLGNFRIEGSWMGTVDNPDTGGYGGYDMVFSPNDNNAWITIPNDENSDAGNALVIGNYGARAVEVVSNRGTITLGGDIEMPGVPQHFHIAFAQSNLYVPYNDLFLGDDQNAVQIHGQDGAPYFGVNIRATDRATEGNTTYQWRFGTDGGMVFPDNTTQTTAWAGIPGPYADDAAAATAGVSVGNPYYQPSGQVFVRLA